MRCYDLAKHCDFNVCIPRFCLLILAVLYQVQFCHREYSPTMRPKVKSIAIFDQKQDFTIFFSNSDPDSALKAWLVHNTVFSLLFLATVQSRYLIIHLLQQKVHHAFLNEQKWTKVCAYAGSPRYRRSFTPQKRSSSTSKHDISFLWVIFVLLAVLWIWIQHFK